MATEPKDILQRLSSLKTVREPWEPDWQDITDYVLPRRSFWDIDSTKGKKPSVKIYDGSALAALQLLVDGLQGYLVSAKIRWSRLVMEDWRQQNLPDVPDWLEEVDDVLFGEFARSNFYEAIGEFFLDAASIGTACMFVEDDVAAKRINFSTRHMKEVYIAEGRTGLVDVVYRDFVMTNRQAYQTWKDALCPQRLDAVKRDPFGSAHIIHACFPRGEYDDTKSDQMNAPYASVYLDKDHSKIIDEGGFQMFPYLVWRWRKNSDEVYGRSPASDAINDILRVNQIGKDMLEASHLAVYPPMNVPAAMRGMTKFIPRGENFYVKPDELAFPINMSSNYPIGLDQENALKDQIRETFRTKIFLLMEQLEKGPYTATEIRERQGEKAAVLGSTIGRLNSETLVPLIARVYHICERNGLIPPPPPALAAGGRVKVEMQGPLAQSQKQYHELQGVNTSLQFISGMAQMFPESMDNVDADELMRRGLDSTGAPQKTIREIPAVVQIRRKKAEALAAEQKAAVALEREKIMGANAESLNQPLKPDSMLAAAAAATGQGG